jgi:DNA-binding MarR family transcriptional regulator
MGDSMGTVEDVPLPDDWATLWFLVRRTAGLMDRAGEALFRRELGISLAQFLVLSVVDAHPGPLSQQAIADRLGLTKGTVSRQIDAAVTAGLMSIEVSRHNRRENQVRLTPAGDALVRRGDTAYGTARHALLPDLDPGDLSPAIRILAALNAALDPGAPALPGTRSPEPGTTGRDSSGKEQHNRPA